MIGNSNDGRIQSKRREIMIPVVRVDSEDCSNIEKSNNKQSNNEAGQSNNNDDMGIYPPPQTTRPLSSQQLSLLKSLPSNDACIECNSPSKPAWASVTYGICLCLDCAGIHRGLGTHLSYVRSLTMDDWTDDQHQRMVNGGNAKWRSYWEAHGRSNDDGSGRPDESELGRRKVDHGNAMEQKELRRTIRFKYESNVARVYREALSLNAKEGCTRLRRDSIGGAMSPPTAPSVTPSPSTPTMEAPESLLPEESPPTFEDMLTKQAWPFALSIIGSPKARAMVLLWAVLGVTMSVGVHYLGSHSKEENASSSIASSLPSSVNPVAHGYMGATTASSTTSSQGPFSFFSSYNLLALGILALTAGIPYFLLRKLAFKIARGMLANRQDAFKSARNLLMDRIAIGRAARLERCDVYYPARAEGGGEARAKCGLIFYPGALIDRTAYAPIALRLSEMGVLVAVANLEPARLIAKLSDYPLREKVMHILTDSILVGQEGTSWTVDEWAIGGHSLGGNVAICAVVNELSNTIKKVVLWGVSNYPDPNIYPCKKNLREITDVNVLVINGSEDNLIKSLVIDPQKHVKFEENMPPSTEISFADVVASGNKPGHTHHLTIEGGNHAGCAHYGPQTYPMADGIRTITLEQQQRRTAEATAGFLLGSIKRG